MICGFLATNEWSAAGGSLTATSAAAGLPAAATQDTERTYVWRSLSQTADQVLTRDLGSSKAVTYCAAANVKRQGGGTLKLYQGGTGGSPGAWTLVATLPDQNANSRIGVATFASVSARHWKLEWANGVPATPDYAECGYIGLGLAFEPTRACQVPVPFTLVDPSIPQSSPDGQTSFTVRTPYATGTMAFKALSQADHDSFETMRLALGVRTPFFFSLDTGYTKQQWLMRFAGDLAFERRHVPGRYNLGFEWTEAR